MDVTQVFPINLNVCFHPNLIEAFLICPDLIEAVGPYPNVPIVLKCFLILPNKLLNFCIWPKFDEGCWNYHMIPIHSRAVFILPSGAKKNGKIVSDYFAVFAIIFPLIWLLFCLSLENRHNLIACECSCILCPNFENFCPNNGQYFSIGDATASPCHTLMLVVIKSEKGNQLMSAVFSKPFVLRTKMPFNKSEVIAL